MSCDHKHTLTNMGGCAALSLTRPLLSFYTDPVPRYVRHQDKPAGDKPPPAIIPPGPQNGPGFRVIGGTYATMYAPPDFAPGPADLTLGAVRAGA